MQVLIEVILASREQQEPIRTQLLYAVMRLINDRSDLQQHVPDVETVSGLLEALLDLKNKDDGRTPWYANLVRLAQKQVCYPDATVGLLKRAMLMEKLAELMKHSKGRAMMTPEALLELTFSVVTEIKSSSPGDQPGLKPHLATSVSALCRLLVIHHGVLPRGEASGSDRSISEALSSSFRELSEACTAHIDCLGPSGTFELAEASSFVGGGVTWALMKVSVHLNLQDLQSRCRI